MLARRGGGARGCVVPGSVLTATVDETPRDFSPRVVRHVFDAFGGHMASYIAIVRYTTIYILRP
jgi:hypothetical protein